jgi:hypothetical protein
MRKLVPGGIESSVVQAKVGCNIDDFATLLEQRRDEVHGLAAGE